MSFAYRNGRSAPALPIVWPEKMFCGGPPAWLLLMTFQTGAVFALDVIRGQWLQGHINNTIQLPFFEFSVWANCVRVSHLLLSNIDRCCKTSIAVQCRQGSSANKSTEVHDPLTRKPPTSPNETSRDIQTANRYTKR